MARIVFAGGTSHTPMLLAADETLPRFVETDRRMKHRDKDGRPVTYGDLLETADPALAALVAPQHLVARQNVARAAAQHLREVVGRARLDALVVFGDDQNESYRDDCRPTFAIYCGDTIRNGNAQHSTYNDLPEWYIRNRAAFFEPVEPRDYPVHGALALHLAETLAAADFDVAVSKTLREGEGEGHAMAYVHRHVLDTRAPVPIVPVFLNTYFPPNQPTPRRCYRLGEVVRQAVDTLPGEARVGVLASGGLSHFLVDEELDRAILKALAGKDAAFVQALPRNKLHAGSSEILNWVAVAGAAEGIDLDWCEYVPGYRTPAGTGTGMSFATWS
ncbi:MAG: extradiol ring-cleavage dioxygenase [Bradyrhizobiaceae bacterium]|nr:extradiol ring-cleavage dioxygenase [Bradyrhizobiaceae bacterium]